MSGIGAADYVEHKSRANFQSTVDRLVTAIEKAGMSVFASIDHADGAKAVGMSIVLGLCSMARLAAVAPVMQRSGRGP